MSHYHLFCPLRLGQLHLANRIIMHPMTRSRASQPGDVANAMMASYYAQRAEAGLIISEAPKSTPFAKATPRCRGSTAPSRSRAGSW